MKITTELVIKKIDSLVKKGETIIYIPRACRSTFLYQYMIGGFLIENLIDGTTATNLISIEINNVMLKVNINRESILSCIEKHYETQKKQLPIKEQQEIYNYLTNDN